MAMIVPTVNNEGPEQHPAPPTIYPFKSSAVPEGTTKNEAHASHVDYDEHDAQDFSSLDDPDEELRSLLDKRTELHAKLRTYPRSVTKDSYKLRKERFSIIQDVNKNIERYRRLKLWIKDQHRASTLKSYQNSRDMSEKDVLMAAFDLIESLRSQVDYLTPDEIYVYNIISRRAIHLPGFSERHKKWPLGS